MQSCCRLTIAIVDAPPPSPTAPPRVGEGSQKHPSGYGSDYWLAPVSFHRKRQTPSLSDSPPFLGERVRGRGSPRGYYPSTHGDQHQLWPSSSVMANLRYWPQLMVRLYAYGDRRPYPITHGDIQSTKFAQQTQTCSTCSSWESEQVWKRMNKFAATTRKWPSTAMGREPISPECHLAGSLSGPPPF